MGVCFGKLKEGGLQGLEDYQELKTLHMAGFKSQL